MVLLRLRMISDFVAIRVTLTVAFHVQNRTFENPPFRLTGDCLARTTRALQKTMRPQGETPGGQCRAERGNSHTDHRCILEFLVDFASRRRLTLPSTPSGY